MDQQKDTTLEDRFREFFKDDVLHYGQNGEKYIAPIERFLGFISSELSKKDEWWIELQKRKSDTIIYPDGHISTNWERLDALSKEEGTHE